MRHRLLVAYDTQLRGQIPGRLPKGVRSEQDGPLVRLSGATPRGFIDYRELEGLDGAELDELIERQVRVFADRSERFEWKLHGHDRPADLSDRLLAAGLVPEAVETVMIAPVADIVSDQPLPPGVRLREVSERVDLERIAALEEAVWRDDRRWLVHSLESEKALEPEALAIVVAEAGNAVVSAGWVRFAGGTEFGTLWGGATLPVWRSRGIYRAVVAHRAKLAGVRGFRYLQVDASSNSRPILERLGFIPVTTTTPFVWSPPSVGCMGRQSAKERGRTRRCIDRD